MQDCKLMLIEYQPLRMILLLKFVCCVIITFSGVNAAKEFGFASFYQDNMVLQAAPHRAVIWGFAQGGGIVDVALDVYSLYSTEVSTVVNGMGVWNISFDPQEAGTRASISASVKQGGKMHISRISNVVFGDVWICGGQSNMLFPLAHVFNYQDEIRNASEYPDIRVFTASQILSETPLLDLEGITQDWAPSSPETVLYFSSVCWLYARNLYDKLKTPIGLISSNWGGTPIESWSSSRALTECGLEDMDTFYLAKVPGDDAFRASLLKDNKPQKSNSVLWNAMIHPFIRMVIKGAIWYQGEANGDYHEDSYNCSFPAMIKDWRKSWYEATDSETDKQFPFGFVQISTTELNEENGRFPLIRWHQTADHGYAPNEDMPDTFMAVSLDLPDSESPDGAVHPRYKQDVALRLSASALKYVYDVENAADGPFPISAEMEVDNLRLRYGDSDLKVNANTQENFEICCSDKSCDVGDLSPEGLAEWVPAKLMNYDGDSVAISTEECPQGVKKVRYAWATVPCEVKKCQIYNKENFPAPPFVMDVTCSVACYISRLQSMFSQLKF